MDFAPPMATGDTLAGVASAAKTLGIKKYKPVPGWQTIYFSISHLVTKKKALSCENCHAGNGVLNFKALGYSDFEVGKLTSPEIYFSKIVGKTERRVVSHKTPSLCHWAGMSGPLFSAPLLGQISHQCLDADGISANHF